MLKRRGRNKGVGIIFQFPPDLLCFGQIRCPFTRRAASLALSFAKGANVAVRMTEETLPLVTSRRFIIHHTIIEQTIITVGHVPTAPKACLYNRRLSRRLIMKTPGQGKDSEK